MSAWRTVDSRWAMTSVVRPTIKSASPARTSASLAASSALVGSSRSRQRRLAEEGPGDGQPLPLSAGQPGAALADFLLESAGKGFDEAVRMREAQGLPHLGVAWRLGRPSSTASRTLPEKSTGSWATQAMCARSAEGRSVWTSTPSQRMRPADGRDEAQQGGEGGGLARAGGPHQGRRLPGRHLQRQAGERLLAALVSSGRAPPRSGRRA